MSLMAGHHALLIACFGNRRVLTGITFGTAVELRQGFALRLRVLLADFVHLPDEAFALLPRR